MTAIRWLAATGQPAAPRHETADSSGMLRTGRSRARPRLITGEASVAAFRWRVRTAERRLKYIFQALEFESSQVGLF